VKPEPLQLIHGDARHLPLADASVQCIVTSPPYWGLRKYAGEQEIVWLPPDHPKGSDFPAMCPHEWDESSKVEIRTGLGLEEFSKQFRGGGKKQGQIESFTVHRGTCARCGAWRGAFGLEPTIDLYIHHTVEILRECRRVLRADGVLFWNIGDSYASGAFSVRTRESVDVGTEQRLPHNWFADANKIQRNGDAAKSGCKPKDLCLIPARVALAAQADGWWVRSVIVWCKPNPMPESATDRPTDAYEHILMLTKSERYFWDADAVREPATCDRERGTADYAHVPGGGDNSGLSRKNVLGYTPKGPHSRGNGDGGPKARQREAEGTFENWTESARDMLAYRNMRNVWMFATQPYSGAHFATFPEELPRRCILAATSAKGCCAQCGAPWERVTDHRTATPGQNPGYLRDAGRNDGDRGGTFLDAETITIGWRPTCTCRGQRGKTAPCTVLDPFGGSGTTGRVALELRRRAILLDIAYNAEYRTLAERRTREVDVQLPFLS
jgi:DNA modification methylase